MKQSIVRWCMWEVHVEKLLLNVIARALQECFELQFLVQWGSLWGLILDRFWIILVIKIVTCIYHLLACVFETFWDPFWRSKKAILRGRGCKKQLFTNLLLSIDFGSILVSKMEPKIAPKRAGSPPDTPLDPPGTPRDPQGPPGPPKSPKMESKWSFWDLKWSFLEPFWSLLEHILVTFYIWPLLEPLTVTKNKKTEHILDVRLILQIWDTSLRPLSQKQTKTILSKCLSQSAQIKNNGAAVSRSVTQ